MNCCRNEITIREAIAIDRGLKERYSDKPGYLLDYSISPGKIAGTYRIGIYTPAKKYPPAIADTFLPLSMKSS